MRRLSILVATATLVALQVLAQPGGAPSAGPALTPVTWERLVNAEDEPENWLMYSGTLDSQRFSRLDQVGRPASVCVCL